MQRDSGFREAQRAQVSFLAPLEKRCLVWLARRTPSFIDSDHLTALGFVSMLGSSGYMSPWIAMGLLGNLALYYRGATARLFGQSFPLYDAGGVIGLIGMALMLITAVARHTVALYRAERIP
jgi:hypothetical protein